MTLAWRRVKEGLWECYDLGNPTADWSYPAVGGIKRSFDSWTPYVITKGKSDAILPALGSRYTFWNARWVVQRRVKGE